MRPSRIIANILGPMLFVQVILGGGSAFLRFPIALHLLWGIATFAVLIAATVLGFKDYGSSSNMFKIGAVAIVIFILQGILGLISFSSNVAIVVHLTNAFVLAVLVTYMISFADSLDKRAKTQAPMPEQPQPSG